MEFFIILLMFSNVWAFTKISKLQNEIRDLKPPF